MGAGTKLKQILKESGCSVSRLARESGISAQTLYTIIKRDSSIRLDFAIRIAYALEIDPVELCKKLDIKNDFTESKKPVPETLISGYSRMLGVSEREKKLNQSLRTLTIIADEVTLQQIDSLLSCYSKLSDQGKAEVDQYVRERGLLQEDSRTVSVIR